MLRDFRHKVERRLARKLYRDDLDLGGKSSVVSFTFDDVPQSACTHGADAIGEAGGRATFYVCGAYAEQHEDQTYFTVEDCRRLDREGHEIGDHGFSHTDYQTLSDAQIHADLDANAAFFRSNGLAAPRQFAFPYGSVNMTAKRICAQRFVTARGVQSAANAEIADRALLRAVHLYEGALSDEDIHAVMDRAAGGGHWIVFLSHAVIAEPGPYDTSPRQLDVAIGAALAAGLPMMTMSDAHRHFSRS